MMNVIMLTFIKLHVVVLLSAIILGIMVPQEESISKIKENHESYHILTPQQFFHKLLKGRLCLNL